MDRLRLHVLARTSSCASTVALPLLFVPRRLFFFVILSEAKNPRILLLHLLFAVAFALT
jgi:hypothetical protein